MAEGGGAYVYYRCPVKRDRCSEGNDLDLDRRSQGHIVW